MIPRHDTLFVTSEREGFSVREVAERHDAVKARTVQEFCRVYGVGKSLVYELLSGGALRAVKAGKRTLILEESARAWFDSLPPAREARK